MVEGIQSGKQTAVPILAELGLSSDEIAKRLDLSAEDIQRILSPKQEQKDPSLT